jgi:putative PIN family toxin of toxin-antitoxin system
MLDTNVLISMVFFPNKRFAQLIEHITREHTLILSSFVVEELVAVAEKKFPSRKDTIDRFLSRLAYELVYTPHKMQGGLFDIRDRDDYPVLYTAIVENVDVLITGDKDFADVSVEKPEILTPTAFIAMYMEE